VNNVASEDKVSSRTTYPDLHGAIRFATLNGIYLFQLNPSSIQQSPQLSLGGISLLVR